MQRLIAIVIARKSWLSDYLRFSTYVAQCACFCCVSNIFAFLKCNTPLCTNEMCQQSLAAELCCAFVTHAVTAKCTSSAKTKQWQHVNLFVNRLDETRGFALLQRFCLPPHSPPDGMSNWGDHPRVAQTDKKQFWLLLCGPWGHGPMEFLGLVLLKKCLNIESYWFQSKLYPNRCLKKLLNYH